MRLTPDKHLHSREHLLADDLSRAMLEPKRFASYLGVAKMYYESDLRSLAKRCPAVRADRDAHALAAEGVGDIGANKIRAAHVPAMAVVEPCQGRDADAADADAVTPLEARAVVAVVPTILQDLPLTGWMWPRCISSQW